MSNSAEWLPLKKFAKKFHHGKNAVRKLVQEGKLPPDKTRIDGVKLMIHESAEEEIRPLLHKGRPESDPELQPEEAIEYDGFTLTPDMIRRLEEVRQKTKFWGERPLNKQEIEQRINERIQKANKQ